MAVRVKICGITRLEDALPAVNAGADALGFVFYDKSPRHVSASQAAAICTALPPFITRVGLFVDAPADFVKNALQAVSLDLLRTRETGVGHREVSQRQCDLLPQ